MLLRALHPSNGPQKRMILIFEDEPLTNTVSALCLRISATIWRHLLLGKGGPRTPGRD